MLVTSASDEVRSTTLPLSAYSGSCAGSWPRSTFGSVPDLRAATTLALVLSALAMYCPVTLTADWLLLKFVSR